ncbi:MULTISPECIES: glutathione transferase GstA [unclassified Caballeronia]|uniref:glutathione transferase GstA n=1 Tax=unclassified Caballeronia TaxID=2646786 RepID=UPI0028651311|nr:MULTISPECIES: glutathione transferase GstA [unclassified Caballeronia]MDR5749838.1 glutathione transferase GstA [Caballeronia sp. LZ024]MDR5843034.1 glutathione transferase GstA [Caballeronia sp. LZ031]
MKLFYKAGACSLASHIALRESGLPFDIEAVDLQKKLTASGADFLQINAKGYIPALQLNSGEVLTEGAAILQYIADQTLITRLAPVNGSIERYRLQGWLNFIGTELHKNFSPFFNPAANSEWKAAAMANLERRLAYVAQQLEVTPYLLGDAFSIADAYLFTVLGWAKYIDLDLGKWPALVAYQTRVGARASVQAAMKAEGLI